MHRSRPADATAGPEGAYSLDSCEEEKNLAMNPLIPFCWLVFVAVVGDAGVDVVVTSSIRRGIFGSGGIDFGGHHE